MSRPFFGLVIVIVLVLLFPVASSTSSYVAISHVLTNDAHRFQSPAPTASSGTTTAVSWPTYLYNVERTGANFLETTIAPSNVSELKELWTVPTNGSDFSSPIVVNGTLYYGSWNGYEYAINASNGHTEWGTFLGTDDCSDFSPMGISSTPAYENGTLYLGGGDGYWYALNASTGEVDWRYYVGAPPAVNDYDWASALVYQNSVYIGVASCADNPLVRGALIQVNITGPHTANHTFYTVPPGEIGDSIWTSPAVDPQNNTIWVTTGNQAAGYPPYANAVIALNASTLNLTGSWQVPYNDTLNTDSDFGSTPSVIQTATGIPLVIASDKNGYTYALNRSNVTSNGSWAPLWSVFDGGGFSTAVFDGHTLYVAGFGLWALDPSNGSILWHNGTMPFTIASPTWANGVVYVGAGSEIYAVDAQTGVTLWNATVPGNGSVVAEPVVVDGRLYVPSGNYSTEGNLTAYGFPLSGNASAGPLSGPAPLNVSFTAEARGGAAPYTYRWVFGDGTFGSGASAIHTFRLPGNYTTHLWINDSLNESLEQNFSVTVGPHPDPALVAVISPSITVGGEPLTVYFNGSEVGGNLPPYSYSWEFGDGTNASGVSVSHTYTELGDFPVTLTVIDGLGTAANSTILIQVVPQTDYSITFDEVGLPSGALWSVTFNGTERSLTTNGSVDALSFSEPEGIYSYRIATVSGWEESSAPYSGTETVSGTAITVVVAYSRVVYSVTFSETGLPAGVAWYVNFTGGPSLSNPISGDGGTSTSVLLPNGTYMLTVASSNKSWAPAYSSELTVVAAPLWLIVQFSLVTYSVDFVESGLPIETLWSVFMNGAESTATGTTIMFSETNGSYEFTVGALVGYTANRTGGALLVHGTQMDVGIRFTTDTPSSSPVGTVLPSWALFEDERLPLVASLVGLAVALTVMILWRRKGRSLGK